MKEGGVAADEAEDEGGKKRDSPCGRSIPGICPDSYEFPTDPAILSRPPPCTSTESGRVATGTRLRALDIFSAPRGGMEM